MTCLGIPVRMHHNPACSPSRNILGLIRNAGMNKGIVEYLNSPPSREEVLLLVGCMGICFAICCGNAVRSMLSPDLDIHRFRVGRFLRR